MRDITRREILLAGPGLLAAGLTLGAPLRGSVAQALTNAADVPASELTPIPALAPTTPATPDARLGLDGPPRWPGFPRHDLKLVREVVGAAHRDEQKVRELVDATPALVNAWWDWGFGDWESPLGAASHVGRRSIAEFLIERGARIDIFAAAMLGMTDVVKAFVAAKPGVQRLLGPHGIPLLAHASAGGEEAAETLAYLETLGDAGAGIATTPLDDARKPAYVGDYSVEGAGDTRVRITLDDNKRLSMEMDDVAGYKNSQRIHYLGDDAFYPAGVPSVQVRFAMENEIARSLTIVRGEPLLVANRVGV
jgi:hypothetical protein